jgi:hypothetical protein
VQTQIVVLKRHCNNWKFERHVINCMVVREEVHVLTIKAFVKSSIIFHVSMVQVLITQMYLQNVKRS